jgi:hypothetical protein
MVSFLLLDWLFYSQTVLVTQEVLGQPRCHLARVPFTPVPRGKEGTVHEDRNSYWPGMSVSRPPTQSHSTAICSWEGTGCGGRSPSLGIGDQILDFEVFLSSCHQLDLCPQRAEQVVASWVPRPGPWARQDMPGVTCVLGSGWTDMPCGDRGTGRTHGQRAMSPCGSLPTPVTEERPGSPRAASGIF